MRSVAWFERTGPPSPHGPLQLVQATEVVGESTTRELRDAKTWLVETGPAVPAAPAEGSPT